MISDRNNIILTFPSPHSLKEAVQMPGSTTTSPAILLPHFETFWKRNSYLWKSKVIKVGEGRVGFGFPKKNYILILSHKCQNITLFLYHFVMCNSTFYHFQHFWKTGRVINASVYNKHNSTGKVFCMVITRTLQFSKSGWKIWLEHCTHSFLHFPRIILYVPPQILPKKKQKNCKICPWCSFEF